MNPTRKVWHDKNNVPPTNYIWYKNGKYLENIDGKWVETSGINNSGSGISPDMSETEQMQARKDLGLYYEESGIGEKTAKYNGESGSQTVLGCAKISEDTPDITDIVDVIVGGSSTEYQVTEQDDGYVLGVQYFSFFRIVLNDSVGNEPGIYVFTSAEITLHQELVYNGQTTVVSKVPEKYLPSSGPVVVSDITNLSSDVLLKAKAGDVFVEKNATTGTETVYVVSFVPHSEGSFGDDVYNIYFVNIDGTNTTVVRYNTTGFPNMWNYAGKSVFKLGGDIGPVTLSAMPTASMTTQEELDAIGLTVGNIAKLAYGQATGLVYNPGGTATLCGIHYIQDVGVMGKYIEFEVIDMIYNITIPMAGSITVTVTQKS